MWQYGVAVVIAVATLVAFFAGGPAAGDVAGGVPETQPRLQRHGAVVAAAAAVRAAGADPGVVGGYAAFELARGAAGPCSCSPSASC